MPPSQLLDVTHLLRFHASLPFFGKSPMQNHHAPIPVFPKMALWDRIDTMALSTVSLPYTGRLLPSLTSQQPWHFSVIRRRCPDGGGDVIQQILGHLSVKGHTELEV